MVDWIWAGMIIVGIAFAAFQRDIGSVTTTIFEQAAAGLGVAINLIAIISVWFGLSRVAERAGLLHGIARLLAPLLRPLFPTLPKDHPSLSSIAMNLTANVLGLANAATPFGLKAMEQLQQLNEDSTTVTPSMITFLALNSACATLLPTTAIALRARAGALDPSVIIVPAAVASSVATVSVLIIDGVIRRLKTR